MRNPHHDFSTARLRKSSRVLFACRVYHFFVFCQCCCCRRQLVSLRPLKIMWSKGDGDWDTAEIRVSSHALAKALKMTGVCSVLNQRNGNGPGHGSLPLPSSSWFILLGLLLINTDHHLSFFLLPLLPPSVMLLHRNLDIKLIYNESICITL